jgi:hypothetical protein
MTSGVPRGVARVPAARAAQIASYLPIPVSGVPASAPPAPPTKPVVPPNGPTARMPSLRLPDPSDRLTSTGKHGLLEWLPEHKPPQPPSVRFARNAIVLAALMLLAAGAGLAYLLSVEPRYEEAGGEHPSFVDTLRSVMILVGPPAVVVGALGLLVGRGVLWARAVVATIMILVALVAVGSGLFAALAVPGASTRVLQATYGGLVALAGALTITSFMATIALLLRGSKVYFVDMHEWNRTRRRLLR